MHDKASILKRRSCRQHLMLLLLLCAAYTCSSQSFQSRLDSIVHRFDSLGGYNGMIVLGFGADSVLTLPYGFKDPSTQAERIIPDDPFDIASLTKQFTGLAVLQLMDQDKLSADDPIGKYIPELKPALQQVTVRQLANHTNGIHDFYSLTTRHDTLDGESVLEMLSKLDSTVFVPGSKWGYSNSGYFLLSVLVERVAQQSFADYCAEHLFGPLGMTQFQFAPADSQSLTGYTSTLQPIRFNIFSSGESGLYLSAHDLSAYYKTVIKDSVKWGKYFDKARELADESNEKGWKYGFGWYFTEDDFGAFRAHSGRNDGAYTYVRWYDSSNVFVCLLSNKNDAFIKQLREEVAALMISEVE